MSNLTDSEISNLRKGVDVEALDTLIGELPEDLGEYLLRMASKRNAPVLGASPAEDTDTSEGPL
jgi:hypothetical protein